MNTEAVVVGTPRNKSPSTLIPMMVIGALFFVYGFVTWMNGSLIPFLKIACELNEFQALWVAAAFYIAYTVTALPAAAILRRVGYKRGMVMGLGIMVVGALLFIPAARTTYYPLFLFALFTLGSGLTLLQTATNPYIVCLGPRETAAVRISIMGLINKCAGVVVPVVFTMWVLTGMDRFSTEALAALTGLERSVRLDELSARLVLPYIILAVSFVAFMVFVHFSPLAEPNFDDESEPAEKAESVSGIFQFPQLILGALALFMYVGVEVIAGDTIGLYGRNLGVEHFGSLTSYTMAFMLLGYIVGILTIPKYITQSKALLLSAVLGIVFTIGVLMSSKTDTGISQIIFGWIGIAVVPNTVVFLALLGFANALVWPAIWPLALEGLGKYTSTGSALLIMGIAGGAVLPLLYGHFSHSSGDSQSAYWVMIPCYVFILFYAIKGYKLRSWK